MGIVEYDALLAEATNHPSETGVNLSSLVGMRVFRGFGDKKRYIEVHDFRTHGPQAVVRWSGQTEGVDEAVSSLDTPLEKSFGQYTHKTNYYAVATVTHLFDLMAKAVDFKSASSRSR